MAAVVVNNRGVIGCDSGAAVDTNGIDCFCVQAPLDCSPDAVAHCPTSILLTYDIVLRFSSTIDFDDPCIEPQVWRFFGAIPLTRSGSVYLSTGAAGEIEHVSGDVGPIIPCYISEPQPYTPGILLVCRQDLGFWHLQQFTFSPFPIDIAAHFPSPLYVFPSNGCPSLGAVVSDSDPVLVGGPPSSCCRSVDSWSITLS